jgi:Kef-type K+ transport system membrane component KefB
MPTTIIITITLLILFAYIFDLTASRTRIPTVILLLLCGWGVKQLADVFGINIPDLQPVLPILGTLGLILIVLDGGLELELDRGRIPLITKSLITAFFPMLFLAGLLTGAFLYFGNSFHASISNAIPFCVISSAIAIPTATHLSQSKREFIVYESSLSDILGVVFFNLFALEETLNGMIFLRFLYQILLMALISFVATALLAWLLSRAKHKVRYTPIIFLTILIYEVAKIYHLPALIFILVFGVFLGSLDKIKALRWLERLRPEVLGQEVDRFKDIVAEATFVVRVLFFLLFGYLLKTEQIFDVQSAAWAALITVLIFGLRAMQLKLLKLDLLPLLFIAPRGLITVLLFLTIPAALSIPQANNSLVIQVIIITALIMMVGTIMGEKKPAIHTEPAPEVTDVS